MANQITTRSLESEITRMDFEDEITRRGRENAYFISNLRKAVRAGDDIPPEDIEKYTELTGPNARILLLEQWEEAKKARKKREVIADAMLPCPDTMNPLVWNGLRTNRLLVAILERLP